LLVEISKDDLLLKFASSSLLAGLFRAATTSHHNKLVKTGASLIAMVAADVLQKCRSWSAVHVDQQGILHPVNVIVPRINGLPEHQQQRYLDVTDVTRE
jgi:hypothetical protein